jgi:hypothetical protein
MIPRPSAIARVRALFAQNPCVALLGPPQCGKTTLARMLAREESDCTCFDLESPVEARRRGVYPWWTVRSGCAMSNERELRPEYPADLIESGDRGKFAARYREGTNVVAIDPELSALFPNADAVHRALRSYAKEHEMLRSAARLRPPGAVAALRRRSGARSGLGRRCESC